MAKNKNAGTKAARMAKLMGPSGKASKAVNLKAVSAKVNKAMGGTVHSKLTVPELEPQDAVDKGKAPAAAAAAPTKPGKAGKKASAKPAPTAAPRTVPCSKCGRLNTNNRDCTTAKACARRKAERDGGTVAAPAKAPKKAPKVKPAARLTGPDNLIAPAFSR